MGEFARPNPFNTLPSSVRQSSFVWPVVTFRDCKHDQENVKCDASCVVKMANVKEKQEQVSKQERAPCKNIWVAHASCIGEIS